jgi:hypothetical protein
MTVKTELTVPERAAVALGTAEHEKNLIALSTKYADLVEIKNTAGREQVHSAYMELKNTRVAIKSAGESAREDANAFQKAVIAEVARLTAITATEEGRLQKLRDDYDAEREREKQAKAAAEKARVDEIRKRIAEIQAIPSMLVGKQSETIGAAIEGLETVEITLESHQEFAGEAQVAKLATVQKLWEMFAAQKEHEAEQARLQAEREELARLRAEAEERERVAAAERAEQERVARVARETEEAKLRQQREAHEAELRRQREAEEANLRAEREEAQRQLDAQRAEIAKQQAEIAAAKAEGERIERERLAAIEAAEQAKRDAEAAEQARKEREAREQAESEAREQARREAEQFLANGPGDIEIVEVLAAHYDVGQTFVIDWLAKFDAASFLTPTEKAA